MLLLSSENHLINLNSGYTKLPDIKKYLGKSLYYGLNKKNKVEENIYLKLKPVLDKILLIKDLKEKRKSYFSLNKPIIILERIDSSITWVRDFETYKNIIGIIKNRITRNRKVNNSIFYYGRYHAYEMCKNSDEKDIQPIDNNKNGTQDIAFNHFSGYKRLKKISKKNYKKLHALLWDFHSSPLSDNMKPYRQNVNIEKNIDVFCVHTIRSGIIGRGREKAINIVSNIEGIRSITKKCDKEEYEKLFIKSKICVGCWGFGEWTHMDGYAFFSNTILIKPDTDHVLMDPDMYRSGKRYIACKADYSNLEEIIIKILNNYDYYIGILKKNNKLINSIDPEKCCKHFWKKIREIYKNSS